MPFGALFLIPIGTAIAAAEPSLSTFDLGELESTAMAAAVPLQRVRRSRYLPPALQSLEEDRDEGVRIRIRGRKVKLRVPL